MSTQQELIRDIDAYMTKHGGRNNDWYVGIAADAKQRLFNDHAVDEKRDLRIFGQAESSASARAVEKAYHDAGHDGGPGGGDSLTVYVYAYRKTTSTDP